MALRPVVSTPLASCCTVVSLFGVVILGIFGYGFAHDWPALMGSTHDPADGQAVATTCYVAALVYAAFVGFCSCQVGVNRRYARISI
ncbi:hypothetical protein ACQY0O_005289 [Thecaphora frezii]